ncbi:MAG TPA: septal ring lytic transglycosylase RlpA family protein [Candidatus Binatia bacterium]|nr:septal ring lytic transglycosylase RlpA family protein [Candidatus Binatia bacterium]
MTHLGNGRSVRVRIVDRGPFVRGRSLDLPYGAARRLGMIREGTRRGAHRDPGPTDDVAAGRAVTTGRGPPIATGPHETVPAPPDSSCRGRRPPTGGDTALS